MSAEKEIKKIADLVPDAGNYNKGTEKGRKLIGKSLKKLGAGRSILIDKDGNVIAGNKTLEGAAAAGIDEVIVVKTTGRQIVAVQRTDLEIGSKKGREMALADNATGAANLSWDLEMMAADGWTETDLSGWGVDMPEAEPVKTEAFEDDFEPPAEIEEIQTDIVAGDLFEIGRHRLLCGDSTKVEDVERLMGGERAQLLFTSPPYNLGGSISLRNGVFKGAKSAYENNTDNHKDGTYLKMMCDFMKVCMGVSDVQAINVQSLAGNKRDLIRWVNELSLNFVDVLIWAKTNPPPAMAPKVLDSAFEFIYVFDCMVNPSRAIRTASFGRGQMSNVLSMSVGNNTHTEGAHGATFSVNFAAHYVENLSSFGDSILDPFCGSGTTMVASHQLNRRCFGMEIDPKYCQVILDRMRKLAPDLEVKKNGQPYNNR